MYIFRNERNERIVFSVSLLICLCIRLVCLTLTFCFKRRRVSSLEHLRVFFFYLLYVCLLQWFWFPSSSWSNGVTLDSFLGKNSIERFACISSSLEMHLLLQHFYLSKDCLYSVISCFTFSTRRWLTAKRKQDRSFKEKEAEKTTWDSQTAVQTCRKVGDAGMHPNSQVTPRKMRLEVAGGIPFDCNKIKTKRDEKSIWETWRWTCKPRMQDSQERDRNWQEDNNSEWINKILWILQTHWRQENEKWPRKVQVQEELANPLTAMHM